MSRNTHNSLQARLFAGDASSTVDGSSSIQCESSPAVETSRPSTPASTTLAASAAPTLSPEMISLITQTVRAAMAAEKPPASEQVQAVPSAVPTASAGGVPASNSLDASAANFLASGGAIPLGQPLQGRPSSCVVVPSFVQTFAAPVMSLAPSFTPPSNVIQQAPALATQPASLLDQSFVVGPGFSPVPAKLVAQIVGGKYVDLSDLLAPNLQQREPEPQLMFDGRLVLTLQPKRQRRRIEDIASWMEAFSIFSLVLSSHFPHRWKDLTQYQLLILRTHRHFSGKVWLNYDRAFREHAAATKLTDWSCMNVQLFNFHAAGSSSRGSSYAQPAEASEPSGSSFSSTLCKSWNRGRCTAPVNPCRYAHRCSLCSGSHRAITCHDSAEKADRGDAKRRGSSPTPSHASSKARRA